MAIWCIKSHETLFFALLWLVCSVASFLLGDSSITFDWTWPTLSRNHSPFALCLKGTPFVMSERKEIERNTTRKEERKRELRLIWPTDKLPVYPSRTRRRRKRSKWRRTVFTCLPWVWNMGTWHNNKHRSVLWCLFLSPSLCLSLFLSFSRSSQLRWSWCSSLTLTFSCFRLFLR